MDSSLTRSRMVLPVVLLVLALSRSWQSVDSVPNPHWPEFVRGKGQYRWVLSTAQLDNGITYIGANERLRLALQRMLRGQPIRITAVGGSITKADLRIDGWSWFQHLMWYMQDHYGKHIQGTNGAVGGTQATYMSACHNMHVPKDSDIIILEYAVNDGQARYTPDILRRSQERLLRTLLNYPKRPAVLFAHTLLWNKEDVENWWTNAEAVYNELSSYYHLPAVSHKACCFDKLLDSAPGFNTTPRGAAPDQVKDQVMAARGNVSFFFDEAHIDSLTGQRALAELVMHLFDKTIASLTHYPINQAEHLAVAADLTRPLLPNNYESRTDRCFISAEFQRTMLSANGFTWINEAKGERARWGMVAMQAGATMHISVDSRATLAGQAQQVAILIAHLRSYKGMGQALVRCVSGCTCDASTLEGHTHEQHSQTYLHKFYASQHENCTILIEVSNDSSSGGHKVKVTGVVISEEAGSTGLMLTNHEGALDRAAETRSGEGTVVLDKKKT